MSNPGSSQEHITGPRACFATRCFSLELADTMTKRQQGLMGRTVLAEDAGMLFIFETMASKRKFRMKNTLIPLDMIWMDNTYTIVHIEKDVQPCVNDPCMTYGPDAIASKYVLELYAGTVAELDSDIGDKVMVYID